VSATFCVLLLVSGFASCVAGYLPLPFGMIRPTVGPVRMIAVPPGKYSVVVFMLPELNWLLVLVQLCFRTVCWIRCWVLSKLVFRQCSVIPCKSISS
jgi:hypothetical protein